MLTPQRLAQHLVSRGLLLRDIVDSALRIVSQERNNRNFEIIRSPRVGYFSKQARSGRESLDTEAHFYTVVRANAHTEPLTKYIPFFCDYDKDEGILVLRLIDRARNVYAMLATGGRMDRRVAATLGRAVAAVHDYQRELEELGRTDVPWILSLPAPGIQILLDISAANLNLLRIVQESRPLCRCLRLLASRWRAVSLTHGDLRFANCVVSRRRGSSRFDLKIVDWEMAGVGDSSWDIGCVFAAFLSCWTGSMALQQESSAASLMRSARLPLTRLKPAIAQFWAAYCSARRLTGREQGKFLLNAVRFTAARLVQTAYEQIQYSNVMTRNGVVLLQLAANIAGRPRAACRALLGFDVPQ